MSSNNIQIISFNVSFSTLTYVLYMSKSWYKYNNQEREYKETEYDKIVIHLGCFKWLRSWLMNTIHAIRGENFFMWTPPPKDSPLIIIALSKCTIYFLYHSPLILFSLVQSIQTKCKCLAVSSSSLTDNWKFLDNLILSIMSLPNLIW